MTKVFVLIMLSCTVLLTACGQNHTVSETASPSEVPAIEHEDSPTLEVENVVPITGVELAIPTVSEKDSKGTASAANNDKIPATDDTPQHTAEQAFEAIPPQDIPSVTVHAKTGYVEPEPTPEPDPVPVETADRQAAMDAANAYAVTAYGAETDGSLTLDNSAYRFPASVPADATQATLEAKARDMVDFTFRQLMMQAGVDTLADAGFRCNVCIMEDGGSLLIYVLYDG